MGFISCEKAVEGVTEILFTNVKSGKVSLSLGEEFKLKYMVMPEQLQETAEIEWESSDRKVAVVRRGVIEAKGPGEATITASSGNAKASVLVTVKAIQVEDLDFPYNTISVYLDATVEVRFRNVTPADASLRTVEWEIKDTGDGDATVEADD
ncbi:MAG: Ig-like domain-containing protein, partial [Candidatus Cryptobacteroides sp.]|nr:Ig-like domain-containing protein [Candidatus Cryptobacteroides sp.]